MMIKYENLNLILRRVTIAVAIGALSLAAYLNSFPIEPFDISVHLDEVQDLYKTHEENLYKDFIELSEIPDEGAEVRENENTAASSGNDGGGTYSNESHSYERDS